MLTWTRDSLETYDGLLGTLRRAKILAVDDSGPQQLLNLAALANDMPRNIVRILPHGFSSNPPLNAEGIFKSLAGRSDRGMFIGGEHYQYRPRNLPSGNSVLYDDKGNVVWMNGQNGIAVTAVDGGIVIAVMQNGVAVSSLTLTANGIALSTTGDLSVSVGGERADTTKGDLSVSIGGKRTDTVTGQWNATAQPEPLWWWLAVDKANTAEYADYAGVAMTPTGPPGPPGPAGP